MPSGGDFQDGRVGNSAWVAIANKKRKRSDHSPGGCSVIAGTDSAGCVRAFVRRRGSKSDVTAIKFAGERIQLRKSLPKRLVPSIQSVVKIIQQEEQSVR